MIAQQPTEVPRNVLLTGDAISVLQTLPDNSIDALVTDPPAGISFMGKAWDGSKGGRDHWIAWLANIMTECHRVLKPGAHALVWSLPRTSHWTAMALEDAGFETRDCILHLFGSGFPKNLDISKEIDKRAGATREVIGKHPHPLTKTTTGRYSRNTGQQGKTSPDITTPATDEAEQWAGWGTALKPSQEMWWLCRKPISESNVAANVLRWGTGGINIDACRIGDDLIQTTGHRNGTGTSLDWSRYTSPENYAGNTHTGRWPTNLAFSHSLFCLPNQCASDCPVSQLEQQSGIKTSGMMKAGTTRKKSKGRGGYHDGFPDTYIHGTYGDSAAARFFPQFRYGAYDDLCAFYYAPKADRSERDAGCSLLPRQSASELVEREDGSAGMASPRAGAGRTSGGHNVHPTVKPLALMRWLVRLVTPPGGVVLDCFAGSGTTGVAAILEDRHYVLIENHEPYFPIIEARLANAHGLWALAS